MKFSLFILLLTFSALSWCQTNCDVRLGDTLGIKVVEFATGNVVHSKMSLRETTPDAMLEEMINLQDMGVCAEKILAKKCVLKFEKKAKAKNITMYRGRDRWLSWQVGSKQKAQDFVRHLKRVGFCS